MSLSVCKLVCFTLVSISSSLSLSQCNCAIHTNLIISSVPGRATVRLDKVCFFTPDAQVSRTELRPDQHIICHPLKTRVIHYCHDSPSQRRCITAMKRPAVQGGKEDWRWYIYMTFIFLPDTSQRKMILLRGFSFIAQLSVSVISDFGPRNNDAQMSH